MTRVTNSDQVLLYLRNRLQKLDKTRKPTKSKTEGLPREPSASPLNRVQSLSNNEDLSDEDIKRALIQGILTEEFGTDVSNDPTFQKLVEDIYRTVSEDKSGASLLNTSLAELKTGL